MTNRANEIMANRFDSELARLGDRAYQNREIDARWRMACSHIDQARSIVREMMSEKDREATRG